MTRMLVALSALALAAPVAAQQQVPDSARRTQPLAAVTVTATRSERSTFDVPQPAAVIDSIQIREALAHGVGDLFRDAVGMDASGVGPNQRRPEIRGQRGQRILLLQDGLRLNNARRQQDFGEIPAVAGISSVARVEIVRGPSSVLYGTDALGGVVNLISSGVPRDVARKIQGEVRYRYGSAGAAATPSVALSTRAGRLGVQLDAAYREAEDYVAPAGRFGNIALANATRVNDSGIRDRSYRAALAYDLSGSSEVFARGEWYDADQAGFGWIDPANFGPGQPRISIVYPDQRYSRYTVGYRHRALATPIAHRAELTLYTQRNTRHLNNDILVPMGPSASMSAQSWNFTDLTTLGARVELARTLGSSAMLTYGGDVFSDRSANTDSSLTVITGFGPPSTRRSTVPSVPNASYRSAGVFAQLEATPVPRLTTVLGARAQDVFAATRPTPGVTRPTVSGSDRTAVWTASALYRLISDVNLVGSLARGFRSPNLVERFFEGAATEGNGYQRANPALGPETSLNGDLGLRVRRGVWFAEGFVFRNDIDNAVKAIATGDTVNRRPVFENRNIGRLRIDGLELVTGLRTPPGLDGSISWTRLDGRNISDPNRPTGDSYSSKVVGDIAWRAGRLSLGYTVRYQGEQSEVIVGANPIGTVIPSFVVQSARASVHLFTRAGITNRLSLAVDNLGNVLYAEFPNASFFRPEPGRNVSAGLTTAF